MKEIVTIKPLDLKTLSPTAINLYERCKFQFYGNRSRWDEYKDTSAGILGTVTHKACEDYCRWYIEHLYEMRNKTKPEEKNINNYPSLRMVCQDNFDRIVENTWKEMSYKYDKSIYPFERKLDYRKFMLNFFNSVTSLDNIMGLEHDFSVLVRDDLPKLVGRIDRIDSIEKNGKKGLCVVDYKTDNYIKSEEEVKKNWQTIVYRVCMYRNYQGAYKDIKMKYIYLKTGKEVMVSDPINAKDFYKILNKVEEISNAKATDYKPTPNKLCKWCPQETQKRCPIKGTGEFKIEYED